MQKTAGQFDFFFSFNKGAPYSHCLPKNLVEKQLEALFGTLCSANGQAAV